MSALPDRMKQRPDDFVCIMEKAVLSLMTSDFSGCKQKSDSIEIHQKITLLLTWFITSVNIVKFVYGLNL